MANEEHLAILKQGVNTWNQWRKEAIAVKPNLSQTGLRAANLRHADLSNTNLTHADLSYATLRNADLRDANLIGATLNHATLNGATLIDANLSHASLNKATLVDANLRHANLTFATLNGATLADANLRAANLLFANLNQSTLRNADLRNTNLSHATLHNADFRLAILNRTSLNDTDITGAQIGWTVFCRVDLSRVKGLESTKHGGPSSIGIDTIYESKGNIPSKFLLDAGVPKDDIAYLLSLSGKAINFYSCFISCSSQDKAFVERLHVDLQAKGVPCWVAWEDLIIGEPFLLGIDKGIQLHDKLLLVLSENSVASGWVQHEVLSALAKEQGKEPWVLFPVRLDDTVLDTNIPWANMIKQSRHIGDFTQWKDHDTYQKAFERLLRDLKQGPGT